MTTDDCPRGCPCIGDHGDFRTTGDSTPMPELADYPDIDAWKAAIDEWWGAPR